MTASGQRASAAQRDGGDDARSDGAAAEESSDAGGATTRTAASAERRPGEELSIEQDTSKSAARAYLGAPLPRGRRNAERQRRTRSADSEKENGKAETPEPRPETADEAHSGDSAAPGVTEPPTTVIEIHDEAEIGDLIDQLSKR